MSFLLMLLSPCVSAQVTIGSDVEPRKSVLLDIKQKDTTGYAPNAEGGLGLPRVQLISPTTLTIDNETEKGNYVGTTVYNIGNANIPEGMYSWDGNKWMLSVSVNNYGTEGQLLKSNGNGTFGWSTFVLPEFSYHKPTQISVFDSNKATALWYSYSSLTNGGAGNNNGVKPGPNTFDNSFVYTENLNIQTDDTKDKYILLGIASVIGMTTRDNYTPYAGFWQIVQVDVFINDILMQSNQRLYATAAKSDRKIFVDMFSIVPVTGLGKGTYPLKIKISNVENTFPNNANGQQGGFNTNEQKFYEVILTDINFVLYEDD